MPPADGAGWRQRRFQETTVVQWHDRGAGGTNVEASTPTHAPSALQPVVWGTKNSGRSGRCARFALLRPCSLSERWYVLERWSLLPEPLDAAAVEIRRPRFPLLDLVGDLGWRTVKAQGFAFV